MVWPSGGWYFCLSVNSKSSKLNKLLMCAKLMKEWVFVVQYRIIVFCTFADDIIFLHLERTILPCPTLSFSTCLLTSLLFRSSLLAQTLGSSEHPSQFLLNELFDHIVFSSLLFVISQNGMLSVPMKIIFVFISSCLFVLSFLDFVAVAFVTYIFSISWFNVRSVIRSWPYLFIVLLLFFFFFFCFCSWHLLYLLPRSSSVLIGLSSYTATLLIFLFWCVYLS